MSIARQIVDFAIQAGSSDIHLEEGSPIAIRVNSDIKILENILGEEEMTQLMHELIGEEKLEGYRRTGDLDTSIGLDGLSRIRINAYISNKKNYITRRYNKIPAIPRFSCIMDNRDNFTICLKS